MFLYYCKLAAFAVQWELLLSVLWTLVREAMGGNTNADNMSLL